MSKRLPIADRLRIASKMGMASTFKLDPDEAEAFADLLDRMDGMKCAMDDIERDRAIHAARLDRTVRIHDAISWWLYSVLAAIALWSALMEAYK